MFSEYLFEITPEARQADRARCQAGYQASLAEVLGNGSEWQYTGECRDRGKPNGTCSCGHGGIRYEFTLRHIATGRTVIVGSVCVGTFPGVSQESVEAIRADVERLERESRERIAAARRAALDARVSAALAEYHRLSWELDRILAGIPSNGWGRPARRLAYEAFHRWYGAAERLKGYADGKPHPWARVKAYKQPSAMLKAVNRHIETLNRLIAQPFEGVAA